MPFITLQNANESGEPAGMVLVNTDQIITIDADEKATRLNFADGHIRFVLDKPEEIAKKL